MIRCQPKIATFLSRGVFHHRPRMPTLFSNCNLSLVPSVPQRSYTKSCELLSTRLFTYGYCNPSHFFIPLLAQSLVKITYIEADGTEKLVDAPTGMNLMDVAHENNVELEGACGGELACLTCHLIFEEHIYKTLPDKAEEEDDMLDLAFEVTAT